MKSLLILLALSSDLFGQTYGFLSENKGPDHGTAKNYSWTETDGVLGVPYVRSEIVVNGQTYSYIRTGAYEYKISRKVGNQFKDIVTKVFGGNGNRTMGESSGLLHVYEDREKLNIYSWGREGYNFVFFKKIENSKPQLIRSGFILNPAYCRGEGFDRSVKAIEFMGATQMKITKEATISDSRTVCDYEFRPEGVYQNGIFDPSVVDIDSQEASAEYLKKDPLHYLKKQQLHAARVASWNKEQMDAQAARDAAQLSQPTQNSTPTESVPAVTPTPTAPVITKESPPVAEPAPVENLTPWLTGLIAVLVLLLGYLGIRFIKRRA